MSIRGIVAVVAMAAAGSVFASTINVPSGTTTTTNSLSETDRTYKQGDGTLVVSGSSSFKRMTVSAGTLKFSGGTATIADSTATDAYGDAMFVQSGGNTIIADGAVVTAKDGKFVDVNNGTFIVTNATFDATGITGDMMNAFSGNNSDCWIVIETNGVLKTKALRPTGTDKSAMKECVGVRLNRGGKLYLTQFWIDGKSSSGSIANRYGRVLFDGGILYPSESQLFQASQNLPFDAYGYANDQMTPTILEGGCYIHTSGNAYVYPAFSGIPDGGQDGGLHHSGTGVLYWRTGKWRPSTYNGGTWLESNEGGVFSLNGDNNGDDALGVVPTTPSTNIWVMGSNHTLFNEGTVDIHTNRMIFIKSGKRMYAGSQGRLAIHGEIHGEITNGGNGFPNTILHVKNGGTWNGTVALDPGAGHTNDVGRIVNAGRLEVTSGVVRVANTSASPYEGNALVYVGGNGSSKNNYRGHLIINGGTLVTEPQPDGENRFLTAVSYADVEITNGGKIDMPKACYVNGLNSPASLTISDGGEMRVVTFQFANGTKANSTVDLKSGGRLISNEFWCNETGYCNFNIDGGVIGIQGNKEVAFGLDGGVARWVHMNVFVKEGGVTFDVPSNNLWIKLPLQSAAEQDAGFRKTGSGILVVQTNCVFHGATTVAGGTMQVRGHNMIPQTTLKLENRGTAAFCLYNASGTDAWQRHTQTEQTFKRIEGDGTVGYSKNVHVTEALAPSVDGELTFEWACDLNGDFEIQGNSNTCSRIYSYRDTLDLSKLTLKVADFSTFDPEKAKYKASIGTNCYQILKVTSADRYSGRFNLPADWPKNWEVKYTDKGAFLHHLKGTILLFR